MTDEQLDELEGLVKVAKTAHDKYWELETAKQTAERDDEKPKDDVLTAAAIKSLEARRFLTETFSAEVILELIAAARENDALRRERDEAREALTEAVGILTHRLEQNPYRTSVFPELTDEDMEAVKDLCESRGFPIDRLSGSYGRLFWEGFTHMLKQDREEISKLVAPDTEEREAEK